MVNRATRSTKVLQEHRHVGGRPLAVSRTAKAVVVALVASVAFVLTGSAAFAHHPEVTASSDCKGLVSFTSTAWSGAQENYEASRTNPHIDVYYSTGGAFVKLPWESAWVYMKANGYRFSDTFQLASPLPSTVTVKVVAAARWGNGAAAGDARQTPAITVRGCAEASIADAVCSNAGAEVFMKNPTGGQLTFTVKKGATTVHSVAVASGSTAKRVVSLNENEQATISVSAPTMTTVTKTVKRDCLKPGATIAEVSCTTNGAAVLLDNKGSAKDVTFTVTKDGATAVTKTVGAGKTETVTVPVDEDETAEIVVTATDLTTVKGTVSRDCQEPEATIAAVECSEGGAAVALTNDGEQPVTFSIFKDGVKVADETVAGGQAATVKVPIAEDTTSKITVTAPGMAEVAKDVKTDCIDPTPEPEPPVVPEEPQTPVTPTPPATPTAPVTPNTPNSPAPPIDPLVAAEATPTATPESTAARETQVQGVQLTRPIPVTAAAPSGLARTGSQFGQVVLIGTVLVLWGLAIMVVSQRRRGHIAGGNILIADRLPWL